MKLYEILAKNPNNLSDKISIYCSDIHVKKSAFEHVMKLDQFQEYKLSKYRFSGLYEKITDEFIDNLIINYCNCISNESYYNIMISFYSQDEYPNGYLDLTADSELREKLFKETCEHILEISFIKNVHKYFNIHEWNAVERLAIIHSAKEKFGELDQYFVKDSIKKLDTIIKWHHCSGYQLHDYLYKKIIYTIEDLKKYYKTIIKKEAGRKGGKTKGTNNKQIKDTLTGNIYNSVNDCAFFIKKNRSYISKHKERFITI